MVKKRICLTGLVLLSELLPFSSFSKDQNSITKVPLSYAVQGENREKEDYLNYSDSYFSSPSTTYNPSLATASMLLSLTNYNTTPEESRFESTENCLSGCGFSAITPNEDCLGPKRADTIGAVYGKKALTDCTLLAVSIRGISYEVEWASNFTVGKTGNGNDHEGFRKAADHVLEGLSDYIQTEGITGNIKLWVTGFSRGAATANLLSGSLDSSLLGKDATLPGTVTYTKEDLYTYTFEAPQGAYYDRFASSVDIKKEGYSNIFNIVNPDDVVPKAPFSAFGFARYGVDRFLPNSLNDSNYASDIEVVRETYRKEGGYLESGEAKLPTFSYPTLRNLRSDKEPILSLSQHQDWTLGLYFDSFWDVFATAGLKKRDYYAENLQEGLTSFLVLTYKGGGPDFSSTYAALAQFFGDSGAKKLLADKDNPITLYKDFTSLLDKAIRDADLTISSMDLFRSAVSLVFTGLRTFLSDLSLILPLIDSDNFRGMAINHDPCLALSYLKSMDSLYTESPVKANMEGRYYRLESTDQEKDFTLLQNGKEILKSSKGKLSSSSSHYPCGYESGKLLFYFPVGEGYTLKTEKDSSFALSVYEPSRLRFIDSITSDGTAVKGEDQNVQVVAE